MLRRQGKSIRYEYDGLNRLIRIDYPDSIDTEYAYGDANAAKGQAGRIVSVTDESGQTSYEYGKLGETIRETRTITRLPLDSGKGAETKTMGYRSDYLGRMEEIVYPDGEVVRYTYDHGGQIRTASGLKSGTEFPYVKDSGCISSMGMTWRRPTSMMRRGDGLIV